MPVLPQRQVATHPLPCRGYALALESKCVTFCLQGLTPCADHSRNPVGSIIPCPGEPVQRSPLQLRGASAATAPGCPGMRWGSALARATLRTRCAGGALPARSAGHPRCAPCYSWECTRGRHDAKVLLFFLYLTTRSWAVASSLLLKIPTPGARTTGAMSGI